MSISIIILHYNGRSFDNNNTNCNTQSNLSDGYISKISLYYAKTCVYSVSLQVVITINIQRTFNMQCQNIFDTFYPLAKTVACKN